MRTVHPCIMIGSYGWEQDRVPRDEFQIRVAALNGMMDAKGWKAMLVFGDAREHSDLAFFTNFVPRLRWAMALLPRNGEPRLLISMTPRDMPAMRVTTWIPDVMTGWTWDTSFDPWLARLTTDAPADLGTVRFDLMRPPLMRSLEQSLGNRFRLVEADADVGPLRATRPRERSRIREACSLAQDAGAEMMASWRRGAGIETAALDAELAARRRAAQDVRTLVSFDGGRTLAPFRGAFEKSTQPLLGYIAVKHAGYWAELFVSSGHAGDLQQAAEVGLDAALRAARTGTRAADVHAGAKAALGALAPHPALGGSVGRRIGLSANEGGELTADGTHKLEAGEVYALHVGAHDPARGGAIASAMVAIGPHGCEVLARTPRS